MVKVKLGLKCKDRSECLELAEYIINYRGVRGKSITYDVSDDAVIIEIWGPKVEVTTVKRIVMSAYKEWSKIKSWSKGGGSIELPILMKIIGKPFISEALVEVLKIMGYNAELLGNELRSNAPSHLVIDVAKGLAEKLEELVKYKPKASLTAKALITAYAYMNSLTVKEAMKILEAKNALKIEGYKVLVLSEWRNLLRRLISSS